MKFKNLYKNNLFFTLCLIHSVFVTHESLCLSMRSSWFEVQEQAHDAVVQVFSCSALIDVIRPYKTPEEQYSCGSGFFINEDGFILTNAHVVEQTVNTWIQLPSLGKEKFDVRVVGISVERDIALLKLTDESFINLKNQIERVPYLEFTDSDCVEVTDEVLALGYPLGQYTLKGATGDICGRQDVLIQISAPINPGSSGGPLLTRDGKVVGITSLIGLVKVGDSISFAQGANYVVPSNSIKAILENLFSGGVVKDPRLGIGFYPISKNHIEQLGNPLPGGCFIAEVVQDSLAGQVGMQEGDMIYEINGYSIDSHGMVKVPWSKDKISLQGYLSCLFIGSSIEMQLYRQGEKQDIQFMYEQAVELPIHRIVLGYDSFNYIVFAGMVIMELTLNHAEELSGLRKYCDDSHPREATIIVTHVFGGSDIGRMEVVYPGCIIKSINEYPVHTIDDVCSAFKKALLEPLLKIEGMNTVGNSENEVTYMFPTADILKSEYHLSQGYGYPLAPFVEQAF